MSNCQNYPKQCYWAINSQSQGGGGTCRAVQTCTDNLNLSVLSKGEKVQIGLMTVVLALLLIIVSFLVVFAKAKGFIPLKDKAAADGQEERLLPEGGLFHG